MDDGIYLVAFVDARLTKSDFETLMWPSRTVAHQNLVADLQAARAAQGLSGVPDAQTTETLAWQIVASLRREEYYRLVQAKPVSANRADPNDPSFDAERAVAYYIQQAQIDEAGWLIFLMTHFGRHLGTGWRRLTDVYGALGAGQWDWATVSANPNLFFNWVDANWMRIGGGFGNHRKYESLRPTALRNMRRVVSDYLNWIGPAGHAQFFANAVQKSGNNPHTIFDHLYGSMSVCSFGRLAKFDYLSLIGRYGIAPIEAGKAYLDGATGPASGARLLVAGNAASTISNTVLQTELDSLDNRLNVGMAVLEDALCNWQKSPRKFVHFKG